MTSTEMRQQAAASRSRAYSLESAAARLRVIADSIRGLLSDLSARSREVWRGPAATDFEARADAADAAVKAQASLLVATAAQFEAEARQLRAEAMSLDAQADAADVAAAAVSAASGDAVGSSGTAVPVTVQ